jgi:hypothetical protein
MVDFKALAAPFPPEEVSWRLGSTSKEKMRGMALAYLDARNVMDRLDDVCGPEGWQCKYSHANGIGRYLYNLDSPWVEIEDYPKGSGKNMRIVKGEYRNLDMLLRRATQAILNPVAKPVDGMTEAKNEIAQMQNSGEQPVTESKTAGRTMAELWASNALGIFKGPGFDTIAYKDWLRTPCTPKGTKTHADKLAELREKHPDLAQRIDDAASDLRVAAA